VTHLRRAMLEELQRRGYATTLFSATSRRSKSSRSGFRKSPDRLDQQHVRTFRRICWVSGNFIRRSVKRHVAALRSSS